jgi:hypothetical protein
MEPVQTNDGFMIHEPWYSRAKRIVQVGFPALSTLYFTLGVIWHFPATEQVIGSLAALATFLGVLLGISSRNYNNSEQRFDGMVVITEKPGGGKLYSLELAGNPEDIDEKKAVTFRVGPQ